MMYLRSHVRLWIANVVRHEIHKQTHFIIMHLFSFAVLSRSLPFRCKWRWNKSPAIGAPTVKLNGVNATAQSSSKSRSFSSQKKGKNQSETYNVVLYTNRSVRHIHFPSIHLLCLLRYIRHRIRVHWMWQSSNIIRMHFTPPIWDWMRVAGDNIRSKQLSKYDHTKSIKKNSLIRSDCAVKK